MRMQETILRVIEYGEFERVGGAETIRVDVRIVGATNADLNELVRQGLFRSDLLDRLAFDVVNVPPLRHRRDDILPLAEHFAINIVRQLEREYFPGFTPSCEKELQENGWPGNVRALKNAVERSVYRSTDPDAPINQIIFDPFTTRFDESPPPGSADYDEDMGVGSPSTSSWPIDLKGEVATLEKSLIDRAIPASGYRQARAAELLGLTYHQLRGLLRKHDLIKRYSRLQRHAD